MQLKRSGRSLINPLPTDFGSMYSLYPAESAYTKGFRNTGAGKRIIGRILSVFTHKERPEAFLLEKIY